MVNTPQCAENPLQNANSQLLKNPRSILCRAFPRLWVGAALLFGIRATHLLLKAWVSTSHNPVGLTCSPSSLLDLSSASCLRGEWSTYWAQPCTFYPLTSDSSCVRAARSGLKILFLSLLDQFSTGRIHRNYSLASHCQSYHCYVRDAVFQACH